MNWNEFYEIAKHGIAFADGAIGTMLQQAGLTGDECPEEWNISHSQTLFELHRAYVNFGSMMINTNTFGGNRIKLANYGLQERVKELNSEAVKLARQAAKDKAIVAGSIGPTGKFIEPLGQMTFDQMVEVYKEQIDALANAGVDVLNFETHVDILELKAAILAAREVCDLPIIANMTFEEDGRTVTGTPPEAAFTTLEALGVDVIGTNCGRGPSGMAEIIQRTRHLIRLPMIAQANAGVPRLVNGKTIFDEAPQPYALKALEMIHFNTGEVCQKYSLPPEDLVEFGVNIIGGCCGTTPEHIRQLIERVKSMKGIEQRKFPSPDYLKISSRYKFERIGYQLPFKVIGERLNPTARKKLARDISSGEYSLFKEEALIQEQAGAHILDMNMGIPNIDESELIKKGVEILSTTTKLPIMIDTSNNQSAIAGMRVYPGKPILNSITAESERLELLTEIKKYGAAFVALPIDEQGIPSTSEKRIRLMKKIIHEAQKLGIDKRNILADPLVLAVSAQQEGTKVTLETLKRYRDELGIYSTMGLSNVSFGLPVRPYINRTFLSMAMLEGLTTAIINPLDEDLMGVVRAANVILGKDKNSEDYIEYYAGKKLEGSRLETSGESSVVISKQPEPQTINEKLSNAVIKGNKEGILSLIEEALQQDFTAFEILNHSLIPAIQRVGELYEQKIYFLPQLIISAETMKIAFQRLQPLISQKGSEFSLGRIVMATVKGDVHDIGKNIVIIFLQNQGFEVLDLGKDVPSETILKKAIEWNADIIGLSALMTTTMPRMKEFMELLKNTQNEFKVMVGGAAVTKEFADSIGAYYSSDAVSAAKLAKKLVSKND